MKKNILILMILMLLVVSCGGEGDTAVATPPPAEGRADTAVTIRLMTHDSFDISEQTITQFSAETGIEVEIFKAGDGGAMLNQAVLAKDNPLADVLYGVDNTFLSRALDTDIFLSYAAPALDNIPAALKLDNTNSALPVDFGDVCLNYDKGWFAEKGLAPPQELADLLDPAYAGLVVVENPATSTPGLAFLLATIDTFGEDGYLGFWQGLMDNDVLVVDGWEEAYYGSFSAASDGDRPLVVSYASSPPAEVYFAETPPTEAPTAAVIGDGACFRQIEFVGILKGTEHEAEAQQLVDFLLSPTFQEDIPLHMFVYPANETAVLPDIFIQHSTIPANPATIAPQEISDNREAWVQAWTDLVLR